MEAHTKYLQTNRFDVNAKCEHFLVLFIRLFRNKEFFMWVEEMLIFALFSCLTLIKCFQSKCNHRIWYNARSTSLKRSLMSTFCLVKLRLGWLSLMLDLEILLLYLVQWELLLVIFLVLLEIEWISAMLFEYQHLYLFYGQ